MGMYMLARVLEKSQAPSQARHVLTLLAYHANADGHCYPSVNRLAQMSGLSIRQVQYHLRTLERLNEIRVSIGTGPRGCNEYWLFEAGDATHCTRMISTPAIDGNQPLQSTAPKSKDESYVSPEIDADALRHFLTPGSRVWKMLSEA